MSEAEGIKGNRGTNAVPILMIAFSGLFVALLAALHFLNPRIDPSRVMISYYELGDFGFLMSLAFLSLGMAAMLTAVALRGSRLTGFSAHKVLYLLVAIALVGAGIFYPNDDGGAISSLHTLCGVFVIFCFPILSAMVHRTLVKKHGLKIGLLALGNWLNWIGLVAYMGSTVVLGAIAGTKDGILIGWQNRGMMALYSFWLIAFALSVIKGRLKGAEARR